jgi:hypothetical protein
VGVVDIRILFCCLFGTQSISPPSSRGLTGVTALFLFIYLTVNTAGLRCAVLLGIKMLLYCLLKDTITADADKRLF